jgi:nitrogen fixation protein FixH
VRWILIVLALLIGNVIGVGVLIVKAGSATPRVLPDYYRRAAAFDRTMAEARASAALGWDAAPVVRGDDVDLRLADRAGAPVVGADVSITIDPRGRADRTITATLVETEPGRYRGTIAAGTPGLYLVATTATRGDARFTASATIERAP